MQIGVVFPQTEIGADPAAVRGYAEAVQELGYEHLLAYDHVLGADPAGHPGFSGPYTAASMFHEPFVLFGYLAACAPRLELVCGILVLPQRQTALVAKQAAQVDVLTGGRLRFGVAVGWNEVEYEALGMDFRNRGHRIEEQIELLRLLWQEPTVNFDGRFHHVVAAGINPLPCQRPIPIWMGGSSEASLRRVARLADGYLTGDPLDGDWPGTLEKLHQWRREAGRASEPFGIDAFINVGRGTPQDWLDEATRWQALGASHLSLDTMDAGLLRPDAHIQRLERARQAFR
jgi:probable F420-dependent oxidoreductase